MTYSQRKMAELNHPAPRKFSAPRKQALATGKTQCRSCGADVFWVQWRKSGKKMPVDADPSPGGEVLVDFDKAANTLWATKYYPDNTAAATRNKYTSHFATCEQADVWREK